MGRNDPGCQSCLAKLVGVQVEEEEVHSREEDTDFAAAGNVADFEQAEKEAVTQVTDMGRSLGCRDRRKKAAYPSSLGADHCHPLCAAQNSDRKPQTRVTSWTHSHYRNLKPSSSKMVTI